MDEAVVRAHPEPWNKGKLVGQHAFQPKEIWAIHEGCSCSTEREIPRYSTLVSTASCVFAISLG